MGLNNLMKIAGLLVLLLAYPLNVTADWSGLNEIVQGTWGTGDAQFGFQSGEIKDQFPEHILILSDGKIIVEDWVNNRLNIYQPNGQYLKSMAQMGLGLYELDPDKIISFVWDGNIKNERIEVSSLSQENWLWVDKNSIFNSARASIRVVGNIIYVWDGKQNSYQYSSTGQLVKVSTTRPPELGVVSEKALGDGQYKVTVKYPDKEWLILGRGRVPKYTRDISGNLYGFGDKQVIRYSSCGKELSRLTMPSNNIQEESRGERLEPKVTVLEGYGSPVVAPNGDIYTWKRTPDKYSILRWTWTDDPNVPNGPDAPTGLTLMTSTTGLYLTWTASSQDPGCVTGYEISRATSSGGVGSTVATVDKGVVKYNDTTATAGTTYFYKVRAVAGSEYSTYTVEVSGKK